MQPSSSRAGMTTGIRLSGRAGLVSSEAGIFAYPNGDAGGAGQVGLIFVEGEEFVRAVFAPLQNFKASCLWYEVIFPFEAHQANLEGRL